LVVQPARWTRRPTKLDEEEYVEATKRDGLDREELAREHARGLLAEEVPPTRAFLGWKQRLPVVRPISDDFEPGTFVNP
jgi:hypothetical protein